MTVPGFKVNLFLVGAPKAGTTAMSHYLADHPEICLASLKEPGYFNADFANRAVTRLEDYLSLFAGGKKKAEYRLDASTRYLQSNCAIDNILSYNPNAKFIVMLRNPLEMAPALHAQNVHDGYEDEMQFKRAWALETLRRNGEQIPLICIEPKMLFYREACMLGEHFERLLDRVSTENLHVIIFDDFKKDTARSYRDVLSFLGLPDDGKCSFERINRRRKYKYPRLQAVVLKLGNLKRRLGIHRGLGIHQFMNRHNVVNNASPDAVPDELIKEMARFFRSDVEKLSSLLGRDLTCWLDCEDAS